MKKNTTNKIIAVILAVITLFSVNINSLAASSVEIASDTEDVTDSEIEFDEARFGDVNNDGKINASDARLLLRCSAHLDSISVYIRTYGDYDKDGEITAADARKSLRIAASLEKITCILHGHDFVDFVVNPTCTQEGYTTKRCSRCNATDGSKDNIVPAKGHTLVNNTTKATCTSEGRHTSICSVCGYKDADYQVEAALGHSFSGWTETKESRSRNCKRCNYTEIIKLNTSGKTIYLTFDDGPGPYTKKLLGYLRQYNVKATFFVTNQNPNYMYLLKEMADDGHAIGVHSLTHQWSIYSSVNSYLKDFNAMHKIIKEKTGIDTKIFRFPGGTNNTVSRSYSRGIMATLCKTMTDNGYLYFDWNVDCRDTQGYNSSQIAQTTIAQIKNQKNSIVLMHDIRNSTVEAIKTIIRFGLNNGYKFKVLDESAPSVRFKPVN